MEKIINASINRDRLSLDELIKIINSEINQFHSKTSEMSFVIQDKYIDDDDNLSIKKLCQDEGWKLTIVKHHSDSYAYTITLTR